MQKVLTMVTSLETDDLAWAKGDVDEGMAALERSDFISLDEHKIRNARCLAALKENARHQRCCDDAEQGFSQLSAYANYTRIANRG